MHHEQAAARVADQRAPWRGAQFAFHLRDQFALQEAEETIRLSSSAAAVVRILAHARWRVVAVALVATRDADDDRFRHRADPRHHVRGDRGVHALRGAVEHVEHGIALRRRARSCRAGARNTCALRRAPMTPGRAAGSTDRGCRDRTSTRWPANWRRRPAPSKASSGSRLFSSCRASFGEGRLLRAAGAARAGCCGVARLVRRRQHLSEERSRAVCKALRSWPMPGISSKRAFAPARAYSVSACVQRASGVSPNRRSTSPHRLFVAVIEIQRIVVVGVAQVQVLRYARERGGVERRAGERRQVGDAGRIGQCIHADLRDWRDRPTAGRAIVAARTRSGCSAVKRLANIALAEKPCSSTCASTGVPGLRKRARASLIIAMSCRSSRASSGSRVVSTSRSSACV